MKDKDFCFLLANIHVAASFIISGSQLGATILAGAWTALGIYMGMKGGGDA